MNRLALCRLLSTTPAAKIARIDLRMVAALRAETGMSLQLCQQALEQYGNNLALARERLADLAQAQAGKKQALTNESLPAGLVGLFEGEDAFCMMRLSCKTDFASRSLHFSQLAHDISKLAFQQISRPPVSYQSVSIPAGELALVSELVQAKIAVLQEPIAVDAVHVCRRDPLVLHTFYLHNRINGNMGSVGAIVRVDPGAGGPSASLRSFVDKLARHIAGMRPGSVAELLQQPFVFSPTSEPVQNVLAAHPNATIIDFHTCSAK